LEKKSLTFCKNTLLFVIVLTFDVDVLEFLGAYYGILSAYYGILYAYFGSF